MADRPPRIDVHAVWHEPLGPLLSLGMLTASARHWRGGALGERYEIHRPEAAEVVLRSLAAGTGPAVLLCSNYVWSLEDNLALARKAKAVRPELFVIHGGPSTPAYPGDAERFLDDHGDVADVLVRGEGELILCELLDRLVLPAADLRRLADLPGLTYRDPQGTLIRTDDPVRIADLEALPSPYLTGEFDHIPNEAFIYGFTLESNRGCPYGCTFCDWGSATLSRIRKFDVERVLAEIDWAVARGLASVTFADANFGILARDVDIAVGFGEIVRRHGSQGIVAITPTKNTVKHLPDVVGAFIEGGILVSCAISLQSTDDVTLDAVRRSNIPTDNYVALAAELRRRGQPLMGDLIMCLPGQTYESYKRDLQFFVDHEIMARSWLVKVLPNSPMNAPEYRARWQIETDESGLVRSTSTLGSADIEAMKALRKAQIIGTRLGVLRQVGQFLQWDHAIPVLEFLEHVVHVTTRTPERFPLLTWVFEYFDLHATVPLGWRAFYAEVGRLLAEDYGLDPDASDVATVLRLQRALMPAPERRFPDTVHLAHDYVTYYEDATTSLFTTGHASTGPRRRLRDHPPGSLVIADDPLGLCDTGLRFHGLPRDPVIEGDFEVGQPSGNELDSPLMFLLPLSNGAQIAIDGPARAAARVARIPAEALATAARPARRSSMPVTTAPD